MWELPEPGGRGRGEGQIRSRSNPEQLAGERRQAPVLRVSDDREQLAQPGPPLGGDDPELGEVGA